MLIALALVVAAAGSVTAKDWPQVPQSDLQLTSVAWEPNAPAVVLSEHGRFVLNSRSLSSYLEVYRRMKVLKKEGLDYGSITLPSSDYLRVKELEGRTHLADGSIVPLAENAVFKKEYSTYYRQQMVSFAMPRVEVGSIIEYRYKIYFDSVVYPEPWYFQSALPVLHSEAEYVVPKSYKFRPYGFSTVGGKSIHHEVKQSGWGPTVLFWMNNMPSIADEPSRWAFQDLASQVVVLPEMYYGSVQIPLLYGWKGATDLQIGNSDYGYVRFENRGGEAKKASKRVIVGKANRLDRAKAVYRYVRDEISTEHYSGVGIADSRADTVMSSRRGTPTEKALVLQIMLKKAKIPSQLVWARRVTNGHVREKIPSPSQFDLVLVSLELGGKRIFLDPADPTLAFGTLPPSLEGTRGLLVDRKNPKWLDLPMTPAAVSTRHATVHYTLGEDGHVTGVGKLHLEGQAAWSRLGWQDTPEEAVKGWSDDLKERFGAFEVKDVTVDENIEARTVDVSWKLSESDASAAPGEVSIQLSMPVSRTVNPFTLPPNRRHTPVLLQYPFTETVDVDVSWPQNWEIDASPEVHPYHCPAGSVSATAKPSADQHSFHYTRTLVVAKREFQGAGAYSQVRSLFDRVSREDGEELILISKADAL